MREDSGGWGLQGLGKGRSALLTQQVLRAEGRASPGTVRVGGQRSNLV